MSEVSNESINDVIKFANERMAGFDTEISKRVDQLHAEQCGKAITVIEADKTEQLVGYILPVETDQSKHLVVLKNGTIMVTGPEDPAVEVVENYRQIFQPNELNMKFPAGATLDEIAAEISYPNGSCSSLALAKNDKPDNLPQVSEAITKAVKNAKEFSQKRNEAKSQSIKLLTGSIDEMFASSEEPAAQAPTQLQP